MQADRSNGWEKVAHRFMAERSAIGSATVRTWCRALPAGASVLDLGCGSGLPISEVLLGEGCVVYGVDASPSLVTALHRRFPQVQVACEPVEESRFFDRKYDGIVAVGLIFLLQPDVQQTVIRRVSTALKPRGRFLFTAPVQAVAWADLMTGHQSVSLGDEIYRRALTNAGLSVLDEYIDEGENHYYDVANNQLDMGAAV